MVFESLDFIYHPSRDVKRDVAVKGSTPILVYRVPSLTEALSKLSKQGWKEEGSFEIPHGPICSFRSPGGQRIALYELTRQAAAKTFEGRREF